MDDDREAFEFAYALHLAREVDREAADLIVAAAEAGLIGIEEATALLMEMSGQLTNSCWTSYTHRRNLI